MFGEKTVFDRDELPVDHLYDGGSMTLSDVNLLEIAAAGGKITAKVLKAMQQSSAKNDQDS